MIVLFREGIITILKEPRDQKHLSGLDADLCGFVLRHILNTVPDSYQSEPLLWQLERVETGNGFRTDFNLVLIAGKPHINWNHINIYAVKDSIV